jgi:hypothetical protein
MTSTVLIDSWDMRDVSLGGGVTRGEVLAIPPKPYQARLPRRAD